MNIYTVYDRKAEYSLPCFSADSDAAAIRNFTQAVVSSDTDVSKYPADFDLIKLANYDHRRMIVTPIQPFAILINGLVALTASNHERSRYKKVLDGQLDIEDFTGSGESS